MNDSGLGRHTLLAGTDLEECLGQAVAGGTVSVFTRRSPEKETVNEDAVAVIDCGVEAAVLAIADGAGGARAGDQASSLALNALVSSVEGSLDGGQSLRDAILTGIENANREVLDLGIGAATTLAVVEIQGRTIRTYHVGDSMILVVGQKGKVKLQTICHSPVGYAVEAGVLDEGEAIQHEDRHLVSNFVGTTDMRVEIGSTLRLAPKDTVVVATDGLFDNMHIGEIADLIRRGRLPEACSRLVNGATERMGAAQPGAPCKPDDLGLVLFRPGGGAGRP